MALLDKLLNSISYNDDDDYEDDEFLDDEEDDYPPRGRAQKNNGNVKSIRTATMNDDDGYDRPRQQPVRNTGSKSPIRKTANGMEVCVIKPTSVDDAREITDTLLSNRTVVLNMEGLDVEVAQRIIDFTSGSTYAISGNLQKISHYIFIITPRSVDISGDFQEILSGAFDVPSLNNRF